MSERASATIEDYLNVLFILERDGEAVVGARVAELLCVTPPTVTNTLKRMARDGLVDHDTPRGPQLTELGRSMAKSVVRRHMLAEWMLAHLLPWSKLHEEAHKLEHAISPQVEEALINNLNSPELCPHGNPLPGNEEAVSKWIPLTQAADGDRAIFRRVHEFAEDNPNVLAFLEENGICPVTEIEICKILPFNQTITVCVKDKEVSLGFAVARYVFVEVLPKPEN